MEEIWTFNKLKITRNENNIILDIDVKNNNGFHLIMYESRNTCSYKFSELENFENMTYQEQQLACVKMFKRIMKQYRN